MDIEQPNFTKKHNISQIDDNLEDEDYDEGDYENDSFLVDDD